MTLAIGWAAFFTIAIFAACLDLTDQMKQPPFFFALGCFSLIPLVVLLAWRGL